MRDSELERLREIEPEIKRIAEDMNLTTKEIDFEIVSSRRMIEAMAYRFPTNFSHWSFGRDYDRIRTIYEHRGAGIPYEVVWNFSPPKAFLVETNPIALNILIIAHVYGHVDFYLENKFLKKAADCYDLAREARSAERRFKEYQRKHGLEEYEKTIESAFSLDAYHPPDRMVEREDDERLRRRLIDLKKKKMKDVQRREFNRDKNELFRIKKEIDKLQSADPPIPRYDILNYILEKSPKPLKGWQEDVVSTVKTQGEFFEYQKRNKLLNEGWATFVHCKIMRKLFEEGLISQKEHQEYARFHSQVVSKSKTKFNWYDVGLALFEDLIYRWDRGMHGKEFENSKDPHKWLSWKKNENGENAGLAKAFEVRKNYTDRMAVESFFDGAFIRDAEIYIWEKRINPRTGMIEYVIAEDDPKVIKKLLQNKVSLYGTPIIRVQNGNYRGNNELYLKHEFTGFELNPKLERGALENLYHLWGKPVHLETVEIVEENKEKGKMSLKGLIHTYDGKEHKINKEA